MRMHIVENGDRTLLSILHFVGMLLAALRIIPQAQDGCHLTGHLRQPAPPEHSGGYHRALRAGTTEIHFLSTSWLQSAPLMYSCLVLGLVKLSQGLKGSANRTSDAQAIIVIAICHNTKTQQASD